MPPPMSPPSPQRHLLCCFLPGADFQASGVTEGSPPMAPPVPQRWWLSLSQAEPRLPPPERHSRRQRLPWGALGGALTPRPLGTVREAHLHGPQRNPSCPSPPAVCPGTGPHSVWAWAPRLFSEGLGAKHRASPAERSGQAQPGPPPWQDPRSAALSHVPPTCLLPS